MKLRSTTILLSFIGVTPKRPIRAFTSPGLIPLFPALFGLMVPFALEDPLNRLTGFSFFMSHTTELFGSKLNLLREEGLNSGLS